MDYEAFTREKIARLRAEADALERHLKEFQAAAARANGEPLPSRRSQEGSGFGAVMDLIENGGPQGLTLDQMIDKAAEAGFSIKRNTLRSQLFTASRDGRVVRLEPGRYAIAEQPLGLIARRVDFSADEPFVSANERAEQAAMTPSEDESDDEIPF